MPHQRKTQRDKLAILVATMLEVRSGQVMELAHGLPLKTTDSQSRFQWIKRFLRNDLVKVDEVMGAFSREVLVKACEGDQQPVLIIDQSTITSKNRHELIMVALRVGQRAVPIAWRVYQASGSLGWTEQQDVLEVAQSFLPKGCRPLLMGDRFYGHGPLISWCQSNGWDYCLRLKGWLTVATERDARAQDERKLSQLFTEGKHMLEGVYLTRNRVFTNIAMICDKAAREPWIIATSLPATPATARRYAKRRGIEAMFSDFKSRGFGIEESQLRLAERIDRLVMIMAIALYWAVSTGIREVAQSNAQKNAKSIVEAWFHGSNAA